MFKVTLFWWENDDAPASRAVPTEDIAREWALTRSREVAGRLEIRNQMGTMIAVYKNGVDTMAPVQELLVEQEVSA